MSDFPKAWAIGVINKMQDYYQGRFDNAFPKREGVSNQDYIEKLADIACDVFDGLQPDDIKRGLAQMKQSKFCPVFPEFRAWCLGSDGVKSQVDSIASTYRGKSAALANIEAWLLDSSILITNAEREAYNSTCAMFNNLKWNYSDRQKFYTYDAFRDAYVEVVKEFSSNGVAQSNIDPQIFIETTAEIKKNAPRPVAMSLLDTMKTKEDLEREAEVKRLVDGGMTIGSAYLEIMKQKKKRK